MASGPITLWQRDEEKWKQWQVLFSRAPKLFWMVTKAMELKTVTPWKKNYDKSRQHIKKQKHHFANKGPGSQSCCFSSRHIWMWELDHKEGWAPKNRCFWAVVLEKTLESPLDCKEIKLVNPKGKKKNLNIHWKDNGCHLMRRDDSYWKRPWCWERLKAGGEGNDRGWDGCTASSTQWTQIRANPKR